MYVSGRSVTKSKCDAQCEGVGSPCEDVGSQCVEVSALSSYGEEHHFISVLLHK